MYDTIGQTMYAIGLKVQDILFDVTDPEIVEQLKSLRALASQGVVQMRDAVYALSLLEMRERGFIPSLYALASRFTQATGVFADLRVRSDFPRLPVQVENALYRMAYESLVNLGRHARATGVVIYLRIVDEEVELSVRDDGVGLEQRQAADWHSFSHFGLRAVATSIQAAGGRFSVTPVGPRGIHASAHVPVHSTGRTTS